MLQKRLQMLETVERLRVTLQAKDADWAELLGLTEKEYLGVREGTKDLPITALEAIAQRFELHIERLRDGKVDYAAVVAREFGDEGYIPERYRVASYSRKRTILNVLNYLEQNEGWRRRASMLRYLQLTEASFADGPDGYVNARMVMDTYEFLEKRGFTHARFEALGAYSVVTNQPTSVGRALSKIPSPRTLYERSFTEHVHLWERNCQYKLVSLGDISATVESKSDSEVAEALGLRQTGSASICSARGGIFASGLGHIGLNYAKVRETHCVHRGDPACRYELDYAFPYAQYKRRGNLGPRPPTLLS